MVFIVVLKEMFLIHIQKKNMKLLMNMINILIGMQIVKQNNGLQKRMLYTMNLKKKQKIMFLKNIKLIIQVQMPIKNILLKKQRNELTKKCLKDIHKVKKNL